MGVTMPGVTTDLETVLAKLRACAAQPLEQATAMPPELYSSAALYDHELKEIFAKEWLSPGRAADIPNPGDYLSFAINDQPVFSIRGDDGKIRSFSNVCLHRMMRLVDSKGSCTRLVCPYHAWTYDRSGQLLAAPIAR